MAEDGRHEDGCCTKFATTTGLCCFMDENDFKQKPLAEVVQNDQRRCTDVPCCFLLLFSIAIEVFLIIFAKQSGAEPRLLMHGYDSRILNSTEGAKPMICDGDNSMGAYTVWPDVEYTDIRICQPACSYTSDVDNDLMTGIKYPSIGFMNSYCLPDYGYANISQYALPDSFTNSEEAYQRAVSDLETAAWLILIMSLCGILVSFVYLRVIACVGRMLIIFSILIMLVGGVSLCWLLISDGKERMKDEETENWGKTEFISGIVLSVVLVCFVLALWFMRKNIELIVKMMNEASHAIRDMKFTLIFPMFMALVAMAYMAFWIVEALYIYSVKTVTKVDYPENSPFLSNDGYPGTQYFEYEFNETMQRALAWHFVMLFYISQVIIYFGYMTLAGVFSDWYFSVWDDKHNKIKKRGDGVAELSRSPICESFWRVLRFHLGSLALGALIITIIRIIRAVVTYIQKKVESKPGGSNPLIRCLFCCVQCCLKCCQCIFDRINKEGFIFTTIYGTPYCYSSYTALKLIIHNIGRSMMIDAVSKYTEIFGRIVIALLNTGISIVVMKYVPYYQNNLSSYFLPSVVIFVISYIIAALFMMVFEVAVESIFLCYLVDEEVHGGDAKFANHELTQMSSFIPKHESEDDTELGTHSAYAPPRQKTTDHNVDYTAV